MSEKIAEDYSLRQRLAMRRLEEVSGFRKISSQTSLKVQKVCDDKLPSCRKGHFAAKFQVLACQQREREDSTYSQQCLFCRYMARGNRSKIIHHLYMIHHLNLGSPDNLGAFISHASSYAYHHTHCITSYCISSHHHSSIIILHIDCYHVSN